MNITICGAPGTGTSTLARELAARYGYEVRSAGGALRDIAAERGVSIADAQALAEADPSIDRAIDSAARRAPSGPEGRIAFDSRLAFAFAKGPCLHVKLVCSPEEAARRVLAASRADEGYADVGHALAEMGRRRELEAKRYKGLYGLSMDDPNMFDLVFDTEALAPGEMAEIAFREACEMERDTCHGAVDRFRGDHLFLSNYYACPQGVTIECGGEGLRFGSSEAAYQALKFESPATRRKFTGLGADDAKRFARELTPRADWEDVKADSMLRVLRAKFAQDPEMGALLVRTRGMYLQEGNSWGDNYWGVAAGAADDVPQLNMLGRLLMRVRREVAEESKSA